jgi:hypothetical protein
MQRAMLRGFMSVIRVERARYNGGGLYDVENDMNPKRLAILTAALMLASSPLIFGAPPTSAPGAPADSAPIVLKTRDVKLSRSELVFTGILPGHQTVEYRKAAEATVGGVRQTIYIPKADHYATKNTGRDDQWLSNNSTRIFIDANTDGKLDEFEGWFTNLPIRIGDRNYRVERIADGAAQIELTPLSDPLTGLVVGRKVPPFRFKTADGQTVTQDTYKGKAFLLDIWSVT